MWNDRAPTGARPRNSFGFLPTLAGRAGRGAGPGPAGEKIIRRLEQGIGRRRCPVPFQGIKPDILPSWSLGALNASEPITPAGAGLKITDASPCIPPNNCLCSTLPGARGRKTGKQADPPPHLRTSIPSRQCPASAHESPACRIAHVPPGTPRRGFCRRDCLGGRPPGRGSAGDWKASPRAPILSVRQASLKGTGRE